MDIAGALPEKAVRIVREVAGLDDDAIVSDGVPLGLEYWTNLYGAHYDTRSRPNIYFTYKNNVKCDTKDDHDDVCVPHVCSIKKRDNGDVKTHIRARRWEGESVDQLVVLQGICEMASISAFANDPQAASRKIDIVTAPGHSHVLGVYRWQISPNSIYARCAPVAQNRLSNWMSNEH